MATSYIPRVTDMISKNYLSLPSNQTTITIQIPSGTQFLLIVSSTDPRKDFVAIVSATSVGTVNCDVITKGTLVSYTIATGQITVTMANAGNSCPVNVLPLQVNTTLPTITYS